MIQDINRKSSVRFLAHCFFAIRTVRFVLLLSVQLADQPVRKTEADQGHTLKLRQKLPAAADKGVGDGLDTPFRISSEQGGP